MGWGIEGREGGKRGKRGREMWDVGCGMRDRR